MRLLSIGYVAVLDRLRVPHFAGGALEGAVGERLPATLTTDVALVALAVASAGFDVEGCFSSAGDGAMGRAVTRLMQNRLSAVTWARDCGTPFELQIIDPAGQVQWYSDPGPGLSSLATLAPPIADENTWIYVDGFAWLRETVAQRVPRQSCAGIFVNLGRMTKAQAVQAVGFWRRCGATRSLVVQVSAPSDIADLAAFAAAVREAGAGLAVVTGGLRGLALAGPDSCATALEPAASPIIDAAGAGAAVTAAVLGELLRGLPSLDAVARKAAAAGTSQCHIDGALDRVSNLAWQASVSIEKARALEDDGR